MKAKFDYGPHHFFHSGDIPLTPMFTLARIGGIHVLWTHFSLFFFFFFFFFYNMASGFIFVSFINSHNNLH